MSGASKEGNREKHFRLWKAIEKEVEGLVEGKWKEKAPLISRLKEVVLIEIWGDREAFLMEKLSYCYACKEAAKRAMEDQNFSIFKCRYCPIRENGEWRTPCENGGIYPEICDFYRLGMYKECLGLIREFLSIPWLERG